MGEEREREIDCVCVIEHMQVFIKEMREKEGMCPCVGGDGQEQQGKCLTV